MNEPDSNEYLSAFVDGELQGPARDRVVDALYGSPEFRHAWARFHLIGDAVRKIDPVPGAGSIAGNVSEVLSDEQIVPFTPRPRRPRLVPLAGLALAAAVAAVAVLGIHSLGDGGARSPPVTGVSRQAIAVADPVSTTADSTASRIASTAAKPAAPEASGLKWSDVAPDAEARLNAYLVNHNEYAGNGMRGVLPYVRIVGYQSLAGDYR